MSTHYSSIAFNFQLFTDYQLVFIRQIIADFIFLGVFISMLGCVCVCVPCVTTWHV